MVNSSPAATGRRVKKQARMAGAALGCPAASAAAPSAAGGAAFGARGWSVRTSSRTRLGRQEWLMQRPSLPACVASMAVTLTRAPKDSRTQSRKVCCRPASSYELWRAAASLADSASPR
eukprot:scaffold82162_cov70-Phaeocystis_antarctica.AAC.2